MVAQAIAYTHAYSTFAIRSCLNPELPNNFGNLAPIIAKASGGCVNCKYPTPVNARHIVGMYVPMPILKALYHVIPDRVLAEGAGAVWTIQVRGKNLDGSPFISVDIPLLRRHGRAAQQGRPERDLLPHRRCRRAG
jgi:N-methylhydantoinase B